MKGGENQMVYKGIAKQRPREVPANYQARN